jgi:hypothetical protein
MMTTLMTLQDSLTCCEACMRAEQEAGELWGLLASDAASKTAITQSLHSYSRAHSTIAVKPYPNYPISEQVKLLQATWHRAGVRA